jgi:hypothetical protein
MKTLGRRSLMQIVNAQNSPFINKRDSNVLYNPALHVRRGGNHSSWQITWPYHFSYFG